MAMELTNEEVANIRHRLGQVALAITELADAFDTPAERLDLTPSRAASRYVEQDGEQLDAAVPAWLDGIANHPNRRQVVVTLGFEGMRRVMEQTDPGGLPNFEHPDDVDVDEQPS